MYQYNVTPGSPAATQLVTAGDGITLIVNNDPQFTLWLGDTNTISPNLYTTIPLPPNGYLVVDGTKDVFAVSDSAATNSLNVLVIDGGVSFFQPFSQLVIQGSAAGLFIYSPVAALGTLIGSWSSIATVDKYGNQIPQGINAFQGQLSGVALNNPAITAGSILNAALSACSMQNSQISGGSITETTIVMDSNGGVAWGYTTTTTTVTFNTAGQTSWTSPITGTAQVYCWGADAGAGGGNSGRGGEGGGAAAFAGENAYPVVSGKQYSVLIGAGGTGGTTGQAGNDGGTTSFDNGGVLANPGLAGLNFIGGPGGQVNGFNTLGFAGGNGGGDGTQSTGGCGGGGRAGSTGAGFNGQRSSSSSGVAGGAAGPGIGGHAGGNGGNSGANGNNGGGGGGCGAASSATSFTKQYRLSASATYYGSDGSNPNQKRANGTMYQGGETAGGGDFNGTQKSLGIISGNPASDLAGATIDQVTVRLENLHSWYNSGMYPVLGYNAHTSLPSSMLDSDLTVVLTWFQNQGSNKTTDVTNHGLGTALQNGTAKAITLGPGPAFDLWRYGYFYGAGGDNNQNPLITVKAHTGAAPVTSGSGADGMVTVTYSSTQVLGFALAPVAGSDPAGNAYAVGYTGPVQAFQPVSNPTVVETWHTVTLPTTGGFTGTIRVKRIAESNFAILDVAVRWTGTTTTTYAAGSLPSASYYPTTAHVYALGIGDSPSTDTAPVLVIPTSGAISISVGASSAGSGSSFFYGGVFIIPLD